MRSTWDNIYVFPSHLFSFRLVTEVDRIQGILIPLNWCNLIDYIGNDGML